MLKVVIRSPAAGTLIRRLASVFRSRLLRFADNRTPHRRNQKVTIIISFLSKNCRDARAQFLEWALVRNNYYGTAWRGLEVAMKVLTTSCLRLMCGEAQTFVNAYAMPCTSSFSAFLTRCY